MSEEMSEQRPFPDGKERNVDEDAFRRENHSSQRKDHRG